MVQEKNNFYIYDAILSQSQKISKILSREDSDIIAASELVKGSERIFLVGIGTSLHAAEVGKYLLDKDSQKTVITMNSYDFSLYGPKITNQDCVIIISHRGTKMFSKSALDKAKSVGAKTILITGVGDGSRSNGCDVVVYTVEQEKSSAHTVSYTSAITCLYLIASSVCDVNISLEKIPPLIEESLTLGEEIKELAKKHSSSRRIWLVGAGPNSVTAKEIALKIKETSYLQAEGMDVESMYHGPFQCAEPEDLFILIAPEGIGQKRVLGLIPAIKEVGAKYISITTKIHEDENSIILSNMGESISPIISVVPLQLFTYYLAIEKRTNPDGFRLEDSRFKKAQSYLKI